MNFSNTLQASNSWKTYVQQAAIKESVPVLLLQEICFRESSGRWWARGPEGYVGLCQVGTLAAKQVLGYIPEPWEFANPYFNARVAAKYLLWCKRKFYYWPRAIHCYNAGPGNVSKYKYASQYPKGSYTQRIWYSWQEEQRRLDFRKRKK